MAERLLSTTIREHSLPARSYQQPGTSVDSKIRRLRAVRLPPRRRLLCRAPGRIACAGANQQTFRSSWAGHAHLGSVARATGGGVGMSIPGAGDQGNSAASACRNRHRCVLGTYRFRRPRLPITRLRRASWTADRLRRSARATGSAHSVDTDSEPVTLGRLDAHGAIAFHPEGRSLAAAGRRVAAMWDLPPDRTSRIHALEGFWDSPSAPTASAGDQRRWGWLWDSRTGRELSPCRRPE